MHKATAHFGQITEQKITEVFGKQKKSPPNFKNQSSSNILDFLNFCYGMLQEKRTPAAGKP